MTDEQPQPVPPIPGKGLKDKVLEWLEKEGYPTEFETESVFAKNRFSTHQGIHVQDADGRMREIDLVADITDRIDSVDDKLLRVLYIVECKWSREKPWIIFTSPRTRMAPSAIAAQTIGSSLGQAALWLTAGDARLTDLSLFSSPSEGGFAGRQAFSKENDVFYSAIRSIVVKSTLYSREYDSASRKRGKLPSSSVVVFPMIVVDGVILKAFYNVGERKINISEVDHLRCHWRGAPEVPAIATVDIVSITALNDIVSKRRSEIDTLMECIRV